MRILITGSSGKLGSVLVHHFSKTHEAVQLDVVPPSAERAAIGQVVVGSVGCRDDVEAAMDGVEVIIHCGAVPFNLPPYDRLLHTNIVRTVNLLEAAGNRSTVRQFVFISTIRVHGVLETPEPEFMPRFLPFDETHPFQTVEYYGGSKLQAEHWCRMYSKRFRKPVVVFRPTSIIPVRPENNLPRDPKEEKPNLFEYVATDDVIQAIQLAMSYEPRDGFEAFLLHAPDQRSTVPSLELVERWFRNIPVDKEKLMCCDGFGAFVDCTRAQQHLGWQPRIRCLRTAAM